MPTGSEMVPCLLGSASEKYIAQSCRLATGNIEKIGAKHITQISQELKLVVKMLDGFMTLWDLGNWL